MQTLVMGINQNNYSDVVKITGDYLKRKGFGRGGASTFYGVTPDELLQRVVFQPGVQSRKGKLTLNFTLQGLFCSGCSFDVLQPGGRIASLRPGAIDQWWDYDTTEHSKRSSGEIVDFLDEYVLPFFDATMDINGACLTMHDQAYQFLWSGSFCFVEHGYFLLRAGKFQEAVSIFEAHAPSKVPKFKTIRNCIVSGDFQTIDLILDANVSANKKKLDLR
jgi:hypothetical protein